MRKLLLAVVCITQPLAATLLCFAESIIFVRNTSRNEAFGSLPKHIFNDFAKKRGGFLFVKPRIRSPCHRKFHIFMQIISQTCIAFLSWFCIRILKSTSKKLPRTCKRIHAAKLAITYYLTSHLHLLRGLWLRLGKGA